MNLDRLKSIRLHGLGKFFHGLFMFITYPLRHFFKFLAFLIVFIVILAAIPMMQGVSYRDIPDWYLLRYDDAKEKIPASGAEKEQPSPFPETVKEVSAPKIIRRAPEPVVEPGPGQRQAFRQADYAEIPAAASSADSERKSRRQYPVMKIKPAAEAVVRPRQEEVVLPVERVDTNIKTVGRRAENLPKPEDNLHYRKDENLPLVYEENPQKVSGQAFVFSANEMSVGNTYIILYGIFTDPRKYNQDKAHTYMKELVDGKMLICRIVAYTYNNIATAICFLDGNNINQNLVDAGFADNVAL